mgnify:CR=1 FL=1
MLFRSRERIARDVHDSLGHALVALNVQLEATQRLYRVDPQSAGEQMEAMKALVRENMATLRRTIAGLRAPVLGNRPLRQALHEHCLTVSRRTGMTVSCRVDEAADYLPLTLAETIWAVAQEALTNVEKHAHAGQAELELTVAEAEVCLRVRDDGIGLPDDACKRPEHYGLRGMRKRVEGLGGVLSLHTGHNSAGSGTVVQATLPLVRADVRS